MADGRKQEVELKYRLLSDNGDNYLVARELGPFIAAGPVTTVNVHDRYLDTADWAIARAGYAARERRIGRNTTIELKTPGRANGAVHDRQEISGPAVAQAVPADWPESAARSAILEIAGDKPLIELLVLRQKRHVRRLEGGETRAELSVDEVEVLSGDRLLSHFCELEVEIVAGPPEPLSELAAFLARAEDLRPMRRSKLVRAVRALRNALPDLPEEDRLRWNAAPEAVFGRPGAKAGSDGAKAGSDGAAAGPELRDEREGGPRKRARRHDAEAHAEGPDRPDLEDQGQAERGGAERQNGQLPDAGAKSAGVVPEDALPEAAHKILEYNFGKMRSRERHVRNGSDAEDLHDMRVSTRRLRAAWRIFEGAFKPGRTRRLRRRLRGVSDRLGTVRDLDVLIEGLEAYRAGLDPEQQPGLDGMLALWRRQRDQAKQQLLDELASDRYRDFVHDMNGFLEAGANEAATVASPTEPHRVRDRAPSQIWAAYEAVRAYEPVLPWADVETLHRARISTKWLRYDLEFYGEALGPEADRLLGRVVALQDFLGALHDADVAAKLARDVLVARAGDLSRQEREAIGAYLHSREREVARRRRALGPVWRAVMGAPFRRALGRATASL